MSSYRLFSIPTDVLKTARNGQLLEDALVGRIGTKSSQSDGLVMDNKGVLFYGALNANSINFYNTYEFPMFRNPYFVRAKLSVFILKLIIIV